MRVKYQALSCSNSLFMCYCFFPAFAAQSKPEALSRGFVLCEALLASRITSTHFQCILLFPLPYHGIDGMNLGCCRCSSRVPRGCCTLCF